MVSLSQPRNAQDKFLSSAYQRSPKFVSRLFGLATHDPVGHTLNAPFAVVDVETTGFDAHTDRVVEVAVVHVDQAGNITNEWSSVVNADGVDGASHIHGLPPHLRLEAPSFSELTRELLSLLSGRIVVAHNAPFDESFLASEFGRAGVEVPTLPALCSLRLARRALPNLGRYKLDDCVKAYGFGISNAHTALGDSRALAEILPNMMSQVTKPYYPVPTATFATVTTSSACPR